MRTRVARLAWNRGLISRLGIARADIKRVALAAEVMTNWMCRALGSMMLRPGWGVLNSTFDDARAFFLPFVFSVSDKALVEITGPFLRIWVDDVVVQRPHVSTAVVNANFLTDLSSWTDNDEAGGVSVWVTGSHMGLTGNGTAFAIRTQQVTVAAADQGVEHCLYIVISRGPVTLRVGSASGLDDYITQTDLGRGQHSLTFTPTGDFWIEFKSSLKRQVRVDSCGIVESSDLTLGTPWVAADIGKVRAEQSGDVLFVACGKTTNNIGYQQQRIERRSTTGWSIVAYEPEDGPFLVENTSAITIAASAISGNVTLTASKPIFRSSHVHAIFQLNSIGQLVNASITAQNTFTNSIRVTGVSTARTFAIVITGLTATGSTVLLQRSFDDGASWLNVGGIYSWTADVTTSYMDTLDNQIVLYRIGVPTGSYAGGTILVSLSISQGSITGVARITDFSSSTSVGAEILTDLGSTTATDSWAEGAWSDFRGWPTAVAFHDGRLGWSGRDKMYLSISDAFDGFDPNFEGDAGPITKSIGSGPVDNINWMLSLQRLILGAGGSEFSVRSSSLDEPLTLTNSGIKAASTQGSADVAGVKIDQNGVYVQRGGTRLFELTFGSSGTDYVVDYTSTNLCALVPEIGQPGIIKLVVQRQPDTRLHCVRSDGTAAVLVFDKVEQVVAWMEIETDGLIEDAVVLPGDDGDDEDFVYYVVNRTIDSATVRYLEKWAFEDECRGDAAVCKLGDAFITYSQVASASITGLNLLEGKDVVVWDNGVALADADGEIATFTVTAGVITVTHEGAARLATVGCVGIPYEAPWKSSKFVEIMDNPGGSLTDMQRVESLGLIMADVHAKGLKYGFDLVEANMRDLPEIEGGTNVDPDAVRVDYTGAPVNPPGGWQEDSRLCLLAKAPRPVTLLAAIAKVNHYG